MSSCQLQASLVTPHPVSPFTRCDPGSHFLGWPCPPLGNTLQTSPALSQDRKQSPGSVVQHKTLCLLPQLLDMCGVNKR